jgi:hypothetical protein
MPRCPVKFTIDFMFLPRLSTPRSCTAAGMHVIAHRAGHCVPCGRHTATRCSSNYPAQKHSRGPKLHLHKDCVHPGLSHMD